MIRSLTEMTLESPDYGVIYSAVELLENWRSSGNVTRAQVDPRLRASLPLVEGRCWLLRKDSEKHLNVFTKHSANSNGISHYSVLVGCRALQRRSVLRP